MKLTRDELLKLAHEAGFGLQMNGYASDGVHVDRYETNLWGGPMETIKLQSFANLLIKKMEGRNDSVPA